MKTAVVLLNLGGPDRPEAVQPFLRNLFGDPAIIALPQPLRWLVANLIARRRAPVAREIYAQIGGGSPLLRLTREQAAALQAALPDLGEVRVFVAMRYWHPMSDETAEAVRGWGADRVVLLPLYPQFSGTTTGSSVREWRRAAAGLPQPSVLCCYPQENGLIAAQAELVGTALDEAGTGARLLLSAHGLPEKIVKAGDPYRWQVEQTAAALVAALARPGLDWAVCYQSRVGPLAWIGPSTEAEIDRAGRDRVPVAVAPIAFVSEHSETLVELDIEYRRRALAAGVPRFVRVPAVGTHPRFIAGLADLVRRALEGGIRSAAGGRICPAECGRCLQAA